MMEGITVDETIDCCGLSCPMPLLKTKKAIKNMQSGQVLEIIGTDPGSKNDLPNFAKRSGHEYLGDLEKGKISHYYLRLK